MLLGSDFLDQISVCKNFICKAGKNSSVNGLFFTLLNSERQGISYHNSSL